jgi:hypothetical protein
MTTNKRPSTIDPNDVEEAPGENEVTDTDARKSGRVIRPSTQEIRYEAMRYSGNGSLDDFEKGVLTALQWMLGEKKTLRRSDK